MLGYKIINLFGELHTIESNVEKVLDRKLIEIKEEKREYKKLVKFDKLLDYLRHLEKTIKNKGTLDKKGKIKLQEQIDFLEKLIERLEEKEIKEVTKEKEDISITDSLRRMLIRLREETKEL